MTELILRFLNFLLDLFEVGDEEKVGLLERVEDVGQLFWLLEVHFFLLRLFRKLLVYG